MNANADKPKRRRVSRLYTWRMPMTLSDVHVIDVYQWPLGSVMSGKASGENWTDCVIDLAPEIRLGGQYNTRRVRYDGAFYIVYNTRRVQIGGEVALRVLDVAQHVYGVDADSDAAHNKMLKGY